MGGRAVPLIPRLESSCVQQNGSSKPDADLVRQGGELDSFVAEIEGEFGEVQFVKYKRIAGIVGSMLFNGINVISDEFLELRPRELNND
jgi:hypothetical protein